MSDFSDRPFVAGSVFGLRAFDIDRLGRLISPSYNKKPFRPGENVAECYAHETSVTQAQWSSYRSSLFGGGPSMFSPNYYYAMPSITIPAVSPVPSPPEGVTRLRDYQPGCPCDSCRYMRASGKATDVDQGSLSTRAVEGRPEPPHVLAGVDCKCGFYAYTDGANQYRKGHNASAVIEGYGLVTVGDRGFRAEKAKLRALVLPTPPAEDVDDDGVITYGLQRMSLNALVRRNYPDVPIFDTEALMVAEFPLTTDSLPTPDDDDFWTRSA